MKVYAVESKMTVAGGMWCPWSGSHFFMSKAKAIEAMDNLNHKHHPVPSLFRVSLYQRCPNRKEE